MCNVCNAAAALTTPPPVETPKAQGAKGVGEREFGCLINPVVRALEREVRRAQSEWCQTQEGSREGYGQRKGGLRGMPVGGHVWLMFLIDLVKDSAWYCSGDDNQV